MLLLIDAGNSRIKWGFWKDGEYRAVGALDHAQWAAQAADRLAEISRPDGIWACSVAGARANEAISTVCDSVWQMRPQFATSGASLCGVRNGYENPARLGIDRWLACLGAFRTGNGSVLVVDAGTALTVDYIAADGAHAGGLITPGVGTMRGALLNDTQLRPVPRQVGPEWMGRNTDAAVAQGTLHSAVALIQAAEQRFTPARKLLTGGEGPMLAEWLGADWEMDGDLVMRGLVRYAHAQAIV